MRLLRALAVVVLMAASFAASAADVCNDSLITGVETCDDGGLVNGDGCSDACQIETNWSCSGEPSSCTFTSPCTAGSYWNGSVCAGADEGHYVPADAAIEQKACSMGSYQPGTQSTACLLADENYYVDLPGAISQTPCDAGLISNTGASACGLPAYAYSSPFISGQPAVADDMNEKFTSLIDRINQMQAQLDVLQAYAGPRTAANLVGVYDIFEVSTDVDNDCPTCFSMAGGSSVGTVTFNDDGTGIFNATYQRHQLNFFMQNYSVGFPQPLGDNNASGSMSLDAATVQWNNDPGVDAGPFEWSISGDVVTLQADDGFATAVVAGRIMVFSDDPSEGQNGISIMVRR